MFCSLFLIKIVSDKIYGIISKAISFGSAIILISLLSFRWSLEFCCCCEGRGSYKIILNCFNTVKIKMISVYIDNHLFSLIFRQYFNLSLHHIFGQRPVSWIWYKLLSWLSASSLLLAFYMDLKKKRWNYILFCNHYTLQFCFPGD